MSQINYVGLDLSCFIIHLFVQELGNEKYPYSIVFKTSIGYMRGGDQRQ